VTLNVIIEIEIDLLAPSLETNLKRKMAKSCVLTRLLYKFNVSGFVQHPM